MKEANVSYIFSIENTFKRYSLVFELDNITYKNTKKVYSPEFFVLGLNEKKQWFDIEYFCFEGQPIAKSQEILHLQNPGVPLPRFFVNLAKCASLGIHQLDLLMTLDVEKEVAVDALQNISMTFQDTEGTKVSTTIQVHGGAQDFSLVVCSFRLVGNSWQLHCKPSMSNDDITNMILHEYAGFLTEEGTLEPSRGSRPGPIVSLLGFDKPVNKLPVSPPQSVVSNGPVQTPSIDTPSKVLKHNDTVKQSNTIAHTEPKVSSPIQDESVFVPNADVQPKVESNIFANGTNIFVTQEVPPAEHLSHPFNSIDFSMIVMHPDWKLSPNSLLIRSAGQQIAIGREHRLIEIENVFKNPIQRFVFQDIEIISATIVRTK